MNSNTTESPSTDGKWLRTRAFSVLLACYCSVLFFLWPGKHMFPAGAVSSSSFFLAQLILPRCRFHFSQMISPLNWLLFMFSLQLVLMPAVVRLAGPSDFALPFLPSNMAINLALLLVTVAYWSFCCAVQVFYKTYPSTTGYQPNKTDWTWFPPLWLILLYALIGVAGTIFRFGSIGNLTDYIINPGVFASSQDIGHAPASLSSACAVFLSPFLPFGLILLWCRSVSSSSVMNGYGSRAWGTILMVCVAISYLLALYNRGELVIAMLGMTAVNSRFGAKQCLGGLLIPGFITVLLVTGLTIYRAATPDEMAVGPSARALEVMDLNGMFQDYGAAPQHLGFMLQGTHYAERLGMGRVLISSALAPLPIVGKLFRPYSGTSIYADLIDRDDQPAPLVGELFLDLHVIGVVLGFLVVGVFTAMLQKSFDASTQPFKLFIIQFASVFLSYGLVSSLEVMSQAAIYLSLPIYGFLVFRSQFKRSTFFR